MKSIFSLRFLPVLTAFLAFLSQSCQKSTTGVSKSADIQPDSSAMIIRTPFGPRLRSQVHYIENGYQLSWSNGHLLKVEKATGRAVQDFGEQRPDSSLSHPAFTVAPAGVGTSAASGANQAAPAGGNIISPALNSGWITFAQAANPYAAGYFIANWQVPTSPTGTDNQLLYLFNGMQDGLANDSHILQPVLQFGNNNAWGGYYWTLNNWYASCQKCPTYYGTPVAISDHQMVQGIIRETGNSGGSYSYTSTFTGQPANNGFSVLNVPQLQWLFVTMEAYGMQQVTDYPADLSCQMLNVQAADSYGGNLAALNWQPNNGNADPTVGQHTVVVTNGSNAEIDLYFHPTPPPPPNDVITIYNNTSYTVGINFAGGSNPNLIAGPGTSQITIASGTYNVSFNSGGGYLYYAINNSNRQIAADFSGDPIVTIPGVNFSPDTYTISINQGSN